MADNTTQSVNQAQDATRSVYQTIQDLMGVQMNIFQRLGEVQQKAFSQAVEATNAQFQLLSRTSTPAEKFIYTSRRQRLAYIGPLERLGRGIRISRQVY